MGQTFRLVLKTPLGSTIILFTYRPSERAGEMVLNEMRLHTADYATRQRNGR